MKCLLGLIILFFTSFSHDYREKWVAHTIVEKPGLQTCLLVIIKADTREEAENKFYDYIRRREISLGMKERGKDTYIIAKFKDAIMIEP